MEKDIGKINKNDTTDIVVRVDDFGGRVGVTIREFVTSDRYTGFTKAGVRILADDFKNFKDMINSIAEEDLKQPKDSEDNESVGVSGANSAQEGKTPKAQKNQTTLNENPDY